MRAAQRIPENVEHLKKLNPYMGAFLRDVCSAHLLRGCRVAIFVAFRDAARSKSLLHQTGCKRRQPRSW